jgi:lipopolysaccharide assembly outer membrane protein LptD (OstA)
VALLGLLTGLPGAAYPSPGACFEFLYDHQDAALNREGANQDTLPPGKDSLQVHSDTLPPASETPESAGNGLVAPGDTLPTPTDTLGVRSDTLDASGDTAEPFLRSQIKYNAKDSIVFSRTDNKVYLYEEAKVTYGDIELTADYIEYIQDSNMVFARGVKDSTGKLVGTPIFKEGDKTYDARILRYNFKTQQGYIRRIVTQEQEGYLHSEETKKHSDNQFHFRRGKFTTCEKANPDFYIAMTKGKVIPNKRIVAGPSYLVLEDIPLPIGVPFGFFPIQSRQTSGVVIPSLGEDSRKGFSLEGLGLYLAISDYMDVKLTGNIYSRGSWGANLQYRLEKRYKYTSRLDFDYKREVFGDKGAPDYETSRTFSVRWNHSQSSKANPYSTFSANVNYRSSGYDKRHGQNLEDRVSSNKSSDISYRRQWPNSPFSLNTRLRLNQNSRNRTVNFTLPSASFSMSRQYPLRGIDNNGTNDWYENLQLSYSADLQNKLTTKDSLLFKETTFRDFENGFQHRMPVSLNFKVLKYFNITPNVNYKGVLYPRYIERSWQPDYYDPALDSTYGRVREDTIQEFRYAHSLEPSISVSASPKIFGIFQFKNPRSKVQAIRHVITPSASISFRPSLGGMTDRYYDRYQYNEDGDRRQYSYFDNQIYSPPSSPRRSGSINLGLGNNLEMKVRPGVDTTDKLKKVKLLESLNFNTSYNLFADSLNWSPIRFSGRTNLFNNKLNLNFSGSFDPYALNEEGQTINTSAWKASGVPARLTNFRVSTGIQLGSDKQGNGGQGQQGQQQRGRQQRGMGGPGTQQQPGQRPPQPTPGGNYNYFNVPWSLSLDYSFNYSKTGFESRVTQTLGVNGNFSLTPKWQVRFNTNYDIAKDKLGPTSINITRDLHCFTMSFQWIPIGYRRSYNFSIRVNSGMLRDFLKYKKQRTFYDNF